MNEKKIGYRDIIRQKDFMKTVIADIINRFGDSIDAVAFTWLVYQVTQSASWSAIIFGVNRLPTIFLQPFAGAAIEGRNKKKVMVITDIIRGLCVGFIATALILGFINQWLILASTIIISCAEAFRGPASTALLPKLLEKKYYEFGLSLSKSASSVTELIGLGVAGVIIAVFSVSTAIYIDMATFFLSALVLFTIKVKEEVLAKASLPIKEYVVNLKDGFVYLKKNALLRYFTILAVFLNGILVPFNSLQAPLIGEVLHTNEVMLSVLGIALTVGMIIGAGIYPYINKKLGGRLIACIGGYSIAVFYFTFIFVGLFVRLEILKYLIVALMSFVVGMAISLLISFCNVEFVKNIEEQYMARVCAIFGAACVAAMPVVSFIVGAVAGFVSVAVMFLIAGVADVIICFFLCSKKRFQNMSTNMNELEEISIDEEVIGDSQAF